MTLELKKFDMKRIVFNKDENKGPVIVLIGRRDTGKSYLVRDLLYHQRDVPIGTVISGTESANHFYSDHITPVLIHGKFETNSIQNILLRQKQVMKQVKHQMEVYKKCTIDPRTFVILDDCLYDSSWSRNELMRMIFMNGRHWKIMLIITMQYPLGITPNLRTNVDFVFILRETILGNRRRIYENYAGMFPTFEMFCQFMDQCTENFECIVICNGVQSNKLEDQVFWYKASDHPPFKMCDDSLWVDNKPFSSAMLAQDEYSNGSVQKKNAGPWIHVKKTG
jgi:hypothetical protein